MKFKTCKVFVGGDKHLDELFDVTYSLVHTVVVSYLGHRKEPGISFAHVPKYINMLWVNCGL